MTNEEFIKSVSLEGEEWRDVVGYEGIYAISSIGRISSLGRMVQNPHSGTYFMPPKLLNPNMNNHGYYRVSLYKNGRKKCQRIHRLVCNAFLRNQFNYNSIDHIDGNKLNNNISNLRWCSSEENSNNPNTIRNMSIAAKKRCKEGRTRHKEVVGINIKDNNDVIRFFSMSEAERAGFTAPSIVKCCKFRLKKHKGYRWMYLSDYETLINMSKNSNLSQ